MAAAWRTDVGLAAHTRYRIGGPASRLAVVDEPVALAGALAELGGRPFRVLGLGANTLVSDDGVDEAVLLLGTGFKTLEVEASAFVAGAGLPIPSLVQAARRHGRAGWQHLEAVPGTLGGALRMNAGTRDWGVWTMVEWAEAVLPGEAEPVRLTAADVRPGYRHIHVPEEAIFVRARFRAEPGDPEEIGREHLRYRAEKVRNQPYDHPSCGSVWTNPPGHSVWRLIDAVGMRGRRVGGAQISELHANFIVNRGGARAEDVVALMRETRTRVADEFGIELHPEVCLWGFDAALERELGAVRAEEALP